MQELHAILQNADIGLLQLWAQGNPCQVDYLATIVLEALELWPFAVDVLKVFGMYGKAELDVACSLILTSLYPFFPKFCLAAEANASRDSVDQRHRLELRLRQGS